MATAVFFHAHPDDESIATGGTIAKMADAGHRVIVVFATAGEEGEVAPGTLPNGEDLAAMRKEEAHAAGRILGVDRIVFLGYRDSGMMGTDANGHSGVFWSADVDEAAARLAAVLGEESADVLTVYDDHGGYGHPDHIQVHRVGHRAAELAETPRVYEATINRDTLRRLRERLRSGEGEAGPPPGEEDFVETIGLPESEITTAVDVGPVLDRKKAAMLAHATQMPPDSWFFAGGEETFSFMWSREWFRQVRPPFAGDPIGDRTDSLL